MPTLLALLLACTDTPTTTDTVPDGSEGVDTAETASAETGRDETGATDTSDTSGSDTGDTAVPPEESGRWVSAYYAGYQRDLLPPSEVRFDAITHLIVTRVTPRPGGGLVTNFDVDATNGPAMARELTTRAHAAGRKATLMVGGAGERANFAAAASNATRATFVANLLATMDALGFDGLDLDWEPVQGSDEPLLRALVHDLREARPAMLLTVPVAFVNANFPTVSTLYADLAADVDQINLMTYAMADAWPGWLAWHSSALRGNGSRTPSSVASSVDAYLAAGVPPEKLGVGTGFFGLCWTGVTGPAEEPGSGRVVAGDNAMAYRRIATELLLQVTPSWDSAAAVPYLSAPGGLGAEGCTFVSYEDTRSIVEKGRFVAERGLGGTIVWTVNQGHLPDAPEGEQDPLLDALREAFLVP